MPARRQRAARMAPSGRAMRRFPAYFSSWSARRVGPVNGAHHSSCARPGGRSGGSPIGQRWSTSIRAPRWRRQSRAQERALVAATGAGRRHQQVEQPIHGRMLEQVACAGASRGMHDRTAARIRTRRRVSCASDGRLESARRCRVSFGAVTTPGEPRPPSDATSVAGARSLGGLGGLGLILLFAGLADARRGSGTGYDFAALPRRGGAHPGRQHAYQPHTLGGPFTPGGRRDCISMHRRSRSR